MTYGISVEQLPDSGAPQVGITVDGLDGAAVISVEVSWDGGESWHGVRGAQRVTVVGGGFFRDHVPPLNVEARYRLTVHQGESITPMEPGLSKWRTALSSGSAQVLVVGDSISEGYGATDVRRRWVNLFQQALSRQGAEFPFLPGYYVSGLNWPVVRSGTVTLSQLTGFGWRTAVLQDGTSALQYTFNGTSARLMYVRGATTGVFQVQVDSGPPVVVDTNVGTSPGGASSAAIWATGTLSRGTHTITVTRHSSSSSGQYAYIQGLLTYDGDEQTGAAPWVRVIDGSQSSIGSGILQPSRLSALAAALNAAGGADLVVIALGTNDLATIPSDYRSRIQALISALRAGGFAGSVLLVTMYRLQVWPAPTHEALAAELADIAAGDPDIAHINLRDYMPDVPSPYSDPAGLGYYSDNVHPTDAGMARIAQVLSSVAASPEATITVTSDSAWLQDPLNPRTAVPVHLTAPLGGDVLLGSGALASAVWQQEIDTALPMGATMPVASIGQRLRAAQVPLRLLHDVAAEGGALRRLLMQSGQLVLRGAPTTLLDPVAHVVVGDADQTVHGADMQVSEWSLSVTQVRPQSLRLVVPWFTYQQVQNLWAGFTYDSAKASRPGDTYLDWLRDPSVP